MSGSNTVTTQGSSQPWSAAQPALKTGLQDAQSLYNSGAVGQAMQGYTGSTVVPYSDQTTAGMNAIQNNATSALANPSSSPSSAALNFDQSQFANGGLSGQQQNAGNYFGNLMDNGLSGQQQGASNYFGNLMGGNGLTGQQTAGANAFSQMMGNGGLSAQQQQAAGLMSKTANGDYLGQTSPQFQQLMDSAAQQTADQYNMAMSANGRLGSPGYYSKGLGQGIMNAELPYINQQYGQNLANQQAAQQNLANLGQQGMGNIAIGAGNLANIGQQGLTNTMGAASNFANLGQQGIGNSAGAASNLGNLGQQGVGNLRSAASSLPTDWTTNQLPATDLMKVGGMYEDLAGRTMSDQQRLATQAQQAPLNAVQWLNAIGSGAGQLGGQQSQSTAYPQANPFLTTLMGGLGVNSLLGNPLSALGL